MGTRLCVQCLLIYFNLLQVAPAELEALLLTHPAVADAAVIGVPDLYSGELPRAYITTRPGHNVTEDEIKDFIKSKCLSHSKTKISCIFS